MYRLPSSSVKQISIMKAIYQWEMKPSTSATNLICSFTSYHPTTAMIWTGGFILGATKIWLHLRKTPLCLVLHARAHQAGQGIIWEEKHFLDLWEIHPETAQEILVMKIKLMLSYFRLKISFGERKSSFRVILVMTIISTGNKIICTSKEVLFCTIMTG